MFIYGAPFEIIIALSFLYQLLGLSAFAGLLVLVLGWPLNSYVTKSSIKIQKGVLAARDKRMGIVNELIGAIKFIKFFAWEEQWIDRALNAREKEMKWMAKARTNSVLFTMLWTLAPGLVSLVSFAVFVANGHKLDVATAFTAIVLFGMIRQPLNIIPMYVVQILQTHVALDRITDFLGEEEVGEQVSMLKRTAMGEGAEERDEGLGFKGASFKWNAIEVKEGAKDTSKSKSRQPASETSENAATFEDQEEVDHKFELRDLNVMFPNGKFTIVTGPTASGKTGLLVSTSGLITLLQLIKK
jgi:ABC-type multidrug transport system fused ATPase/permease subunit